MLLPIRISIHTSACSAEAVLDNLLRLITKGAWKEKLIRTYKDLEDFKVESGQEGEVDPPEPKDFVKEFDSMMAVEVSKMKFRKPWKEYMAATIFKAMELKIPAPRSWKKRKLETDARGRKSPKDDKKQQRGPFAQEQEVLNNLTNQLSIYLKKQSLKDRNNEGPNPSTSDQELSQLMLNLKDCKEMFSNKSPKTKAALSCKRNLFDLPNDVVYFDGAARSPLLKKSAEVGKKVDNPHVVSSVNPTAEKCVCVAAVAVVAVTVVGMCVIFLAWLRTGNLN